MNNKKSLISKLLIGGGLLVLICGIFCFFGSVMKMSMGEGDQTATISFNNMFSFMFGTNATMHVSPKELEELIKEFMGGSLSFSADVVGGVTTLFVIEMVIIVLAVILLVGIFAKKLQKKHITIGCCIVCVLAVAAVVLAFCSKKIIIDSLSQGQANPSDYSLGSAGISYGILGIVGILATGAGLFLGKDEVVAA